MIKSYVSLCLRFLQRGTLTHPIPTGGSGADNGAKDHSHTNEASGVFENEEDRHNHGNNDGEASRVRPDGDSSFSDPN